MRIERAVDDYLGELARRGRTSATRQKYREVLYPFLDTLPRELPVAAATKEQCRRFLDRYADHAPATLALYVSILTRFFAYCVDEELVARSPMEKIRRPPLRRPEDLDVVTVSGNEVERLFAACQELDEFLCVALIGYLGPRRSAAAFVRWGDLDFEKGTVRFHEKGGKSIVKPIPDELREMLYSVAISGLVPAAPDDYVVPNRASGPRDGGLVRFVAKKGRRSNKIVYDRVKRVAARAGERAARRDRTGPAGGLHRGAACGVSLDRYDSWALQLERMVNESAASGHPIVVPDPGTRHGRELVLALGAQIDYALPSHEPEPEFAGRPESWYRQRVAEIRAELRAQGVKDRTPGRERVTA